MSSPRNGRSYSSKLNTRGKPAQMPFRHENTSAFGPEDLKILHEVFDLAWQRLLADGFRCKDDEDVNNARRILATCIMTNATPGQLDVQLLFERCLGTFHQRQE
jgi:hypothetical protein